MTTVLEHRVGKTYNIKEDSTPMITSTHSADRSNYRGEKFIVEISLTTQFPAQPSWPPVLNTWGQQLLDLTNAHRRSIGVQALVFHPELLLISDWKVRNCANYLYLDHNTPAEPDWNFPARAINERYNDLGYPNNLAWGENLAYGFIDAQSVFDAWMSDIGHRENLENSSWTTAGMSACLASKANLIFVGQDFGTYQVTPPANAPFTIWVRDAYPLLLKAAQYKNWRNSNPIEAQLFDSIFHNAGSGSAPMIKSSFGLFLEQTVNILHNDPPAMFVTWQNMALVNLQKSTVYKSWAKKNPTDVDNYPIGRTVFTPFGKFLEETVQVLQS